MSDQANGAASEGLKRDEPGFDRLAASEEVYARLFGPRNTSAPDKDPEFGRILRTLIFGDVFATGDLDDQTRELITVTVLGTLQMLPQLKAHSRATLHTGVEPVALREAIYQLAPLIGFPGTLNAIGALNEAFEAEGIDLPLPDQGQVPDAERYAKGLEIQGPIYGTEIADELASAPSGVWTAMPRFLTEFLFADFYARPALDVPTRELLLLCALAALGLDRQLDAHVRGALKVGHSEETLVTALIHAFPYLGFPKALNAIRVVKEVTGR